MFRILVLSVISTTIILHVNMALADDNAIAKAHYSITQQLKQAHDRYRQHKSDYNAGYLKGLEQAQVVLSMHTQATNREEAKAALRQGLRHREKEKERQKKQMNHNHRKSSECTSCRYTISPMEFAKKPQQQSQHQTNQRSKTNA